MNYMSVRIVFTFSFDGLGLWLNCTLNYLEMLLKFSLHSEMHWDACIRFSYKESVKQLSVK